LLQETAFVAPGGRQSARPVEYRFFLITNRAALPILAGAVMRTSSVAPTFHAPDAPAALAHAQLPEDVRGAVLDRDGADLSRIAEPKARLSGPPRTSSA